MEEGSSLLLIYCGSFGAFQEEIGPGTEKNDLGEVKLL